MSSFLPDGGQKSGSSSSEPIMPNQVSSSSNAPGSGGVSSRTSRTGSNWVNHVHEVHHSRMTDEQRSAWTRRVTEVQSRVKSSRRATEIQRTNVSVNRSWADGMRSVTASSAMPGGRHQMMEQAAMSAAAMSSATRALTTPSLRAVDEEAEVEVADDFGQGEEVVALEAQSEDLRTMAEALRVEPDTDAERAAKFLLYENLLESLEGVRRETFSFWDEVRSQFTHDSARGEMERRMKAVDSEGNMGFQWVDGRWFVYDMTLKSQANAQMLDRLLSEIKSKLELLGRSDDCPVCLENFEEETGHAPVVLGCCHKVCQECWTQWTEANRGRRPFCPLCRHEEFLQVVWELHTRQSATAHAT